MNLLRLALRKPVTIIVLVIGILFFSFLAIRSMKIDIFPVLGLPTIYVAQPYAGLSPEQVEGFVTSYYEYHFLYVTGVKSVESRSVQGAAIIKILFQEGTDMSQAMAEVVGYVNRARSFMPPGTVPPFIMRFDAGSVPVGQLVFTSETRSLSEISDLALFRVRPMFSTLPGVSAPPPFGGNQKTVIIKVDPEKVKHYHLTPDDIVRAVANDNTITPAGNIRIGNQMVLTPQNTIVQNVRELENVPLTLGAGPAVYVKDVASVELGADITTSYALVNGKRSVYIPVTKRSTASTWDVVQRVKAAIPDMQAAIPSDIKVSYQFDQSGYVINSLRSLLLEGGIGALLTGLMVVLFLGNLRGALIVLFTIPLASLTGATLLFLTGQTINIMTLGGLALAVGILVDEGTVTIENIHHHQELGQPKANAILNACREIFAPKLLILLCILSVFVPSLFMQGVPKGMFLPMSLAVGFSIIASFFLSNTFVPVISNWILRDDPGKISSRKFERFRDRYLSWLDTLSRHSTPVLSVYAPVILLLLSFLFYSTGKEIFPEVDAGQAQVRLRLPPGTRLERTEEATRKLLYLTDSIVNGNVAITSAFIGTQPSSYPVNLIHLWTCGPNESVTRISLKKEAGIGIVDFKERLRSAVYKNIPGAILSFEPGDLVEQVINLGSLYPIDIAIQSNNLKITRPIAEKLVKELKSLSYLRDVQLSTPLDYPAIKLDIDRVRAGQLSLTVDQIGRSTVTATSSSRFTQPVYWLDQNTGTAYQVQVQYPEYKMNSAGEVESIPIASKGDKTIFLRDVASWKKTVMPGEYDRLNQQRFLTVTANIQGKDLQSATIQVNKYIASLGSLPRGVKVFMRGKAELLGQTTSELQLGLLVAVVVIVLLIAANFQSFRLGLVVLLIIPVVFCGSLGLLWITGNTLNIQSYMGMIMAVGVAVSNGVLFITSAEDHRKSGSRVSFRDGASSRLRPILMTSLAMIAGMLPMASGIGRTADQVAPLGIAVIGGLAFALVNILLFLPLIYDKLTGKNRFINQSLDPEDPESRFHLVS